MKYYQFDAYTLPGVLLFNCDLDCDFLGGGLVFYNIEFYRIEYRILYTQGFFS